MEPKDAPPAWVAPLERFRRWLIANNKSGRTVSLRTHQMVRFARATTVPLERIGPEDVMEYLARPGWEPQTRNNHRGSLVSFFRWATEFNLISQDPTAGLRPVKVKPKYLTPPTRTALRSALAGAEPNVRLMIRLAVEAGLKPMEIARVHTRDVRQTPDGDSILHVAGPNGRHRTVELGPSLADAITTLPEGYAFPGRMDGHFSPAYVSKLVSRAFPGQDVTAESLRITGTRPSRQWTDVPRFHAPSESRLLDEANLLDAAVTQRHLRRIERDLDADPAAAIAECKNLLEATFKRVLTERGVAYAIGQRMPDLYRKVADALALQTTSVVDDPRGSQAIDNVLEGLATTVLGLTRERNALGTGHGQESVSAAEPRHARLAFNATVAVAEYLADTWRDLEVAT